MRATVPPTREITRRYVDWFDQRIDEFINKHKRTFDTKETFMARNGLFITISFDQSKRNVRNEYPESSDKRWSELDRFQDIYNRICRQIVGRNFNRKGFKDNLPLAIGCIDVNGTRYWQSMGEVENVHIHSVWMLTDETNGRFQNLISDRKWFKDLRERSSIRAIDIQRLEPREGNLRGQNRVLSYSAKFIGHNNRDLIIGDDFRMLPI
jgi:hypothetical protein